jgi:hypothetical protein
MNSFRLHYTKDVNLGSGSSPNDLTVIANKKPVQADKVHVIGFRERQGFTN